MNKLTIKDIPSNEQINFLTAVILKIMPNPSNLEEFIKAWKEQGIRNFNNWSN